MLKVLLQSPWFWAATVALAGWFRCGGKDSSASGADAACHDEDRYSTFQPDPANPVRFPIALIHLLSGDGEASTRSAIDDRLQALKTAYEPAGISLPLTAEVEMSSSEGVGNRAVDDALNIFVADDVEILAAGIDPEAGILLSLEASPLDWVHSVADYLGLSYSREDETIVRGAVNVSDFFTEREQSILLCLAEEKRGGVDDTLPEMERERIDFLTVGCEDDPDTVGTVREAVHMISSGGRIEFCRGIRYETLKISGTFEAYGREHPSGAIDMVALDGGDDSGPVVRVFGGADITFRNMTFSGGVAEEGGLFRIDDSTLTLGNDMLIEGEAVNGSALACFNSYCEINDTTSLFDNRATGEGSWYLYDSDGVAEDGLIHSSTAGVAGAGIVLRGGSTFVGRNTHFHTLAAPRGAAIYIDDGDATLEGGSSVSGTTSEEGDSGAVHLVRSASFRGRQVQWRRVADGTRPNIPNDIAIESGEAYRDLGEDEDIYCSNDTGTCQ